MLSHVHLIASSNKIALIAIIRDWEKFTSKALIKTIKEIPESRREALLSQFSVAASRIKKGCKL